MERSLRLKGKVAIVTGAASGFGEGMAKRFAEEGAKVVVADLNAKGAERVAAEIGEAAIPVTTDVSIRAEVDEMVYAAKNAFGRIDIMVNNAGYTHRNGDMLDVDEATFDLITAVNMKAIYHATLAVVPIMERQGGAQSGQLDGGVALLAELRASPDRHHVRLPSLSVIPCETVEQIAADLAQRDG